MSGLGCLQRIKLDQCIPLDNSIDMFWQVMFPSWFKISVGYIIYLLMQTCSLAIICCYEARELMIAVVNISTTYHMHSIIWVDLIFNRCGCDFVIHFKKITVRWLSISLQEYNQIFISYARLIFACHNCLFMCLLI